MTVDRPPGDHSVELTRGRAEDLGTLDPETFKQITTRKSEWSENGKLRVEAKDKMRAEGRHSPDRGDGLLGCIVCGSRLTGAVRGGSGAIRRTPGVNNSFGTGLVTGF